MRVIALDVESARFRPGRMAPPLTCVSFQEFGGEPHLIHQSNAKSLIKAWLTNSNVRLVGHNISYDVAVLMEEYPEHIPLWLKKYEDDLVTDTMVRAWLLDNAVGRLDKAYSLADLYKRATGRVLAKPSTRLEYGELRDVPITEWTISQRAYALGDARATLDVALWQGRSPLLENQYAQARAYLSLHLCSVWGLRTDLARVKALERSTIEERDRWELVLRNAGLVRRDGSKNVAAVRDYVQSQVKTPLLTPTGKVKTSIEVFNDIDTPTAKAMARWSKANAALDREIPLLKSGSVYPIHARFGFAASGRTTTSPNIQNWGRETGARACLAPRPGCVFIQSDFDQFELRGLAQVCYEWFGFSKLGELLASGVCPHIWFAAKIHGISYEAMAARYAAGDKEPRQMAKACLFGFPGGMGAEKFVKHAKKYGIILTIARARELKNQWRVAFPEMNLYFAKIESFRGEDGYYISQLYSNRRRGGMGFNDACNTPFQGICADVAKEATWLIQKECYSANTVLSGSRMVNFIHDEVLIETPDDSGAHDRAQRVAELMIRGAQKYITKVPVKTLPSLTRMWVKEAKPVFDASGRLIPWEKL